MLIYLISFLEALSGGLVGVKKAPVTDKELFKDMLERAKIKYTPTDEGLFTVKAGYIGFVSEIQFNHVKIAYRDGIH